MPEEKYEGKGKTPQWQKWDEGRFWGSETVRGMSGYCALLYRAMLQLAYHFDGSLPDNCQAVAGLLRVPGRVMVRHWLVLSEAFVRHGTRLRHPVVDRDLRQYWSRRSGTSLQRDADADAESEREREKDASFACANSEEEEKPSEWEQEIWEKKSDAIRSARIVCTSRKITSEFMQTQIVRNALDVFYRRKTFKNAVGVFYERMAWKPERIAGAGSQARAEEAAKIVKSWRDGA